jgi:ferredoxin-NADP reductase
VREVTEETPRSATLVFDVDDWPGHRPGQHVDLRLTAEDGYQAERSYSIASAPDDPFLAVTVERIEDGEVSPWLTRVATPWDNLEIRGPVGGYFVWDGSDPAPVLLVAGGSGVVPLVSMARHRTRRHIRTRMSLLYSARSAEDLLFRRELDRMAEGDEGFDVFYTLTRAWPEGWAGYRGRVDGRMLADITPDRQLTSAFVCGPTPFVENVAKSLVLLGYAPGRVKTERFGPSGGSS